MHFPTPRAHRVPAATASVLVTALALALLALSPAFARAAAWYVSPAGDDAAPGTAAQPFATIQHAITASADGDSVMLADGEYSGPGNRDIDMQGKAIRVASISMDPLQCVVNCADPSLTPHLGFIFNGFYNDQAELAGLTVTGATALAWNEGAIQFPDNGSAADVDDAKSSGISPTQAMRLSGGPPVLRRVRAVGNTGNGFYVGYGRMVFTAYECEFSGNSGHGGVTRPLWSARGDFYDCRFNGNGGSGFSHGANSEGPTRTQIHRCQFNDNTIDGLSTPYSQWQVIEFDECEFSRNGGNGVTYFYFGLFRHSAISDNGGWGVYHTVTANDPGTILIEDCEILRNLGGGVSSRTGTFGPIFGGARIARTIIAGNGGPGVVDVLNISNHSLVECLIVDNDGPGVILRPSVPASYSWSAHSQFLVDGSTIANNNGPGLRVDIPAAYESSIHKNVISIQRSAICSQDSSVNFVGILPDTVAVACTDIFGNAAGDWTGLLAPLAGEFGNLSADPLFCGGANAGDPWALRSTSPLASENSPACGRIGARDVGCEEPIVACRSLQVYDPATGAYDPAQLNRVVTVEGVVYVAPGTYSETGGGYLQDESGGINFWRSPLPQGIHLGDRIRVTGPIWPWLGELHIGTYTYAKLDSAQAYAPVDLTIASLLGDFANTGSHVRVTGTVASLTADSFSLTDGAHSIEVRRNAYGQVDFGALRAGALCTVSSPCFMQEGALYLMPPSQADLVVSQTRYVAVDGDDANSGSSASPFGTIQHAINASAPGDTVVVLDGTYAGDGNRDLNFIGKALVLRSQSDNPEACIIDCGGTSADPHYAFWFHSGEDTTSVVRGFKIAGAYVAPPAFAAIMGNYGPHLSKTPEIGYGTATLRNLVVVGTAGTGISSYTRRMDGSGTGDYGTTFRVVDTKAIRNSGYGFEAVGVEMHVNRIDRCEFNENGAGGLDLSGFTTWPWGGKIVADTKVLDNGGPGISGFNWAAMTLSLLRCEIADNAGWGVQFVNSLGLSDVDVARNQQGGVSIRGLGGDPLGIHVVDSTIADNIGDGLSAYGSSLRGATMQGTRIIGNAGRGIVLTNAGPLSSASWSDLEVVGNGGNGIELLRGSPTSLSNSTIAHNGGHGIMYDLRDNGTMTISNSVIAFNGEAAFVSAPTSTLFPSASCSDAYGNLGGDWTGPLASLANLNGNLNVAPQFCDPGNGDYHLQSDSPLAAANNDACGTIGRFEVNCPADPLLPFVPVVTDVPADQGGALRVTWRPHADDAPMAAAPITAYDVQRLATPDWQTVTTLAAAAADTYSIVIATPDVLTIGQPEPWAHYRLVARTAAPAVFFESPVDSAYSTDDLAPPKPAASLVDGLDFRHIVWAPPGIADLASACVYRGTESGFTPGAPLACPADFFTETHLAWYFYRVQFTDTHGNVSEFSDELHGQYPTAAGGLPHALVLEQNVPNPFNPQTSIRFSLPGNASVTGRIFDVSGRLVRTLLDNAPLAAGPHDVAWNGCDDGGRKLPSGGYHFVLESGGERRAMRMTLLR